MTTQHEGPLSGQIGLVTGAGRGIGQAIALSLAAAGMHVVATARSPDEIEETAAMARGAGGSASALTLDVRSRQAVDAVVAEVLGQFGRIDLLVNNAGSNSALGPVWEVDPDLWLQDIEVNLYAPFLLCRAVLPSMIAAGGGRVINIMGGGLTGPLPYDTGYSSSKAGASRFTETLAIEAAPHNVKVFAMGPGVVATRMNRHVFDSPEGRKWHGALETQLEGRWVGPEHAARLATRLALGEADPLIGRMLGIADDLEAMLANIDEIRAHELHTMRLVTSVAGHAPAIPLTAVEGGREPG